MQFVIIQFLSIYVDKTAHMYVAMLFKPVVIHILLLTFLLYHMAL